MGSNYFFQVGMLIVFLITLVPVRVAMEVPLLRPYFQWILLYPQRNGSNIFKLIREVVE